MKVLVASLGVILMVSFVGVSFTQGQEVPEQDPTQNRGTGFFVSAEKCQANTVMARLCANGYNDSVKLQLEVNKFRAIAESFQDDATELESENRKLTAENKKWKEMACGFAQENNKTVDGCDEKDSPTKESKE